MVRREKGVSQQFTIFFSPDRIKDRIIKTQLQDRVLQPQLPGGGWGSWWASVSAPGGWSPLPKHCLLAAAFRAWAGGRNTQRPCCCAFCSDSGAPRSLARRRPERGGAKAPSYWQKSAESRRGGEEANVRPLPAAEELLALGEAACSSPPGLSLPVVGPAQKARGSWTRLAPPHFHNWLWPRIYASPLLCLQLQSVSLFSLASRGGAVSFHPCSPTHQMIEEWNIVMQGSWDSLQSCKSASYLAPGLGLTGRPETSYCPAWGSVTRPLCYCLDRLDGLLSFSPSFARLKWGIFFSTFFFFNNHLLMPPIRPLVRAKGNECS